MSREWRRREEERGRKESRKADRVAGTIEGAGYGLLASKPFQKSYSKAQWKKFPKPWGGGTGRETDDRSYYPASGGGSASIDDVNLSIPLIVGAIIT